MAAGRGLRSARALIGLAAWALAVPALAQQAGKPPASASVTPAAPTASPSATLAPQPTPAAAAARPGTPPPPTTAPTPDAASGQSSAASLFANAPLVLGTLALFVGTGWFLVLFAKDAHEEMPRIETHWGGFGGGMGGIRISASLLYLVVALVLGAAAVVLVTKVPGAPAAESGGRTRTAAPTPRPPE